jgi:methylglutaconyl-CoA hydratase
VIKKLSKAVRKPASRLARRGSAAPLNPATFSSIDVDIRAAVAVVTLNRPEMHNAFDEVLIAELTAALQQLDRDQDVRAVVLTGAGQSFCAGADLNWMKKMAAFSRPQNLADAKALANMLQTLNQLSKPTIARVHGAVFGGGVGLVACCDIAVGELNAVFALSEARLGLIPAAISPYVIEAIGARAARRYFLSGERFTAAEAFRLGLLHELAPLPDLDGVINVILGALVTAGPEAQAECKALIRAVAHRPADAAVIADTARRIARVRATPEAREGIAAFLGKRKASWVPRGE